MESKNVIAAIALSSAVIVLWSLFFIPEQQTTNQDLSQKEKIELINKDLTDSINYAKRIQLQLLPEKTNYKSILPKSFVLYKPKDIVSGDFYWLKDLGNEIIIVCADCTGHGVPGGFVSMIGSILVNEAVVFHNERDPSSIL